MVLQARCDNGTRGPIDWYPQYLPLCARGRSFDFRYSRCPSSSSSSPSASVLTPNRPNDRVRSCDLQPSLLLRIVLTFYFSVRAVGSRIPLSRVKSYHSQLRPAATRTGLGTDSAARRKSSRRLPKVRDKLIRSKAVNGQ
jgi:hypothetical protein